MHIRHLTFGLTLLVITSFVGSAAAKTRPYKCTGSGTFADGVETHINTDGDKVSAGLDQGLQNCNIGRLFFQEEAEYAGPFAPTTCPQGTTEFRLVQQHGVNIDEKTSDQLFEASDADAITLCVNPDGTFSVTGHTTFTGGTGHFTGASGAFDFQSTGKYLAFGFNGTPSVFGGFGQAIFTSVGTITLPKGGGDGQGGD